MRLAADQPSFSLMFGTASLDGWSIIRTELMASAEITSYKADLRGLNPPWKPESFRLVRHSVRFPMDDAHALSSLLGVADQTGQWHDSVIRSSKSTSSPQLHTEDHVAFPHQSFGRALRPTFLPLAIDRNRRACSESEGASPDTPLVEAAAFPRTLEGCGVSRAA